MHMLDKSGKVLEYIVLTSKMRQLDKKKKIVFPQKVCSRKKGNTVFTSVTSPNGNRATADMLTDKDLMTKKVC